MDVRSTDGAAQYDCGTHSKFSPTVLLGKRYTPISVPTMLIWSEQDPYLGKELTYDTAAWATDLRIDYIPEAGHWVHMERPEKVNHLMIDFLKSPSRRGAP